MRADCGVNRQARSELAYCKALAKCERTCTLPKTRAKLIRVTRNTFSRRNRPIERRTRKDNHSFDLR